MHANIFEEATPERCQAISIDEMDRFLQGVPIFEDFDSDKDRNNLETYCKKFKTPRGILLPRHRVVYVVQK